TRSHGGFCGMPWHSFVARRKMPLSAAQPRSRSSTSSRVRRRQVPASSQRQRCR
ncbi:unnamed protein product, partial [Symbiodinium pilosum]